MYVSCFHSCMLCIGRIHQQTQRESERAREKATLELYTNYIKYQTLT